MGKESTTDNVIQQYLRRFDTIKYKDVTHNEKVGKYIPSPTQVESSY